MQVDAGRRAVPREVNDVRLVSANEPNQVVRANCMFVVVLNRVPVGYSIQCQLDVTDFLREVQRGQLGRIRSKKEDSQPVLFARGNPPCQPWG